MEAQSDGGAVRWRFRQVKVQSGEGSVRWRFSQVEVQSRFSQVILLLHFSG